ncbi:two-component system response regulator [Magnetococcus sp. PR-3]|uniref:two-component system response regulator n=1 Tax=Magnetococcus sp. PR-3 TaxID=3120355 RepID=UPI002FCE1C99
MYIAIVDDSPDDRLLLKRILTKAGYGELQLHDSGKTLLRSLGVSLPAMEVTTPPPPLHQGLPDIILMDVMMPDMDGLSVLRQLKANPTTQNIPVIMVTGNDRARDLADAFEEGATDYITKPIRRVELLARLRSIIKLEMANQQVRRSEKRLRDLTASLGEGLLSVDNAQRIVFLNPAGEKLLGFNEQNLINSTLTDMLVPDRFESSTDQAHARRMLSALRGETEQISGETLFRTRGGKKIPISFNAAPILDGHFLSGGVLSFRDIRDKREKEENLKLAAKIFEYSQEGLLVLGPDRYFVDVNPAFSYITGYTREEVIGKGPNLLRSDRHDEHFYEEIWTSVDEDGRWQGEIWRKRKNGEEFPEWLSISAIKDSNAQITHYVGLFSDITTRKIAEEKLKHQAHHDPLTGLPNRSLLEDRLEQAVAKARRYEGKIAVLYMDLDHFKPINDNYGHEAGDAVLREISARLRHELRQSDTAARVGGDEFVAILTEIREEHLVMGVAQKLIHAIQKPVNFGKHTFQVGTSIGVSLYPIHGTRNKTLLNAADAAMYRAKQDGRNRFCVALTEDESS